MNIQKIISFATFALFGVGIVYPCQAQNGWTGGNYTIMKTVVRQVRSKGPNTTQVYTADGSPTSAHVSAICSGPPSQALIAVWYCRSFTYSGGVNPTPTLNVIASGKISGSCVYVFPLDATEAASRVQTDTPPHYAALQDGTGIPNYLSYRGSTVGDPTAPGYWQPYSPSNTSPQIYVEADATSGDALAYADGYLDAF